MLEKRTYNRCPAREDVQLVPRAEKKVKLLPTWKNMRDVLLGWEIARKPSHNWFWFCCSLVQSAAIDFFITSSTFWENINSLANKTEANTCFPFTVNLECRFTYLEDEKQRIYMYDIALSFCALFLAIIRSSSRELVGAGLQRQGDVEIRETR